jgi:hypothetical protein
MRYNQRSHACEWLRETPENHPVSPVRGFFDSLVRTNEENGDYKDKTKSPEKETGIYDGSWCLNLVRWYDWDNSESVVLGTYHRRRSSHDGREFCTFVQDALSVMRR